MIKIYNTNHISLIWFLSHNIMELKMDTKELAQSFVDAYNAGDMAKIASYLADDFTFSGPVPEPIGSKEWLGLHSIFKAAFPDISYNLHVVSVEGNVVTTTSQLKGTHTGSLDLSAMGMSVFPPTGKSFSNPEESGKALIENGKVKSVHIESRADSGISGMLTQLGLQPVLK
jgi:ketosteroid isomerase-like protein